MIESVKIIPNILIVDDVQANIEALKTILRQLEINVIEATNGNDALKLAINNDFALILLDVQMPEMSGYEVAELLQGSEHTKNTPIMFLTANARETSNEERGYLVGGVDYLTKPINKTILLSKTKIFISLYKQKKAITTLNADLQVAIEKAEESNKAKSTFLSNMSHEIRTPLNSILGMLGLIHESEISDEVRRFVNTAEKSGDHLMSLIGNILDIIKIEHDQVTLELIEIDLYDIINNIIEINNLNARKKNLELVMQIDHKIPQALIGDVTRIKQILINLVNNAIKFTQSGHILLSATIKEKTEEDITITFEVSDTGIGIAPDKQSYIFNKFSQADESTTRIFGGTGLGLNISQKLVNIMGGKILLRSELGKGSTFYFDLKLKLCKENNELSNYESLVGKSIIILDNYQLNSKIISNYCTKWKMNNVCFSSVGETCKFFETLSDNSYQFILIDYRTIHMSDKHESERLFSILASYNIKIIISFYNDKTIDASFIPLGISVINIFKPILPHKLLEVLRGSLNEKTNETNQLKQNIMVKSDLSVLIIDDVETNRFLLSSILKKIGCLTEEAENGLVAFEKYKLKKYDLIFMDCQMPVMDGFDAAAAIRGYEKTNDCFTPIIALTADVNDETRKKCITAGMNDIIYKPFKRDIIRAVLKNYIKQ